MLTEAQGRVNFLYILVYSFIKLVIPSLKRQVYAYYELEGNLKQY